MSSSSKIEKARGRFWVPLLAPPLVFAFLLLLAQTDLGIQLENLTHDWRLRARAGTDPSADNRIVVVGIGEYSLQKLGRWEDWNRSRHGDFSNLLTLRPPKVLAWDFFFSENSGDPDDDLYFADYLALHPGAVTGAVADVSGADLPPYRKDQIGKTTPFENVAGDVTRLLTANNGNLPVQDIADSAWTGFVNAAPSNLDGIRRRIPLLVNFAGKIYPSFVLQIVMQTDRARPDDVDIVIGESIRIKRQGNEDIVREIPISDEGYFYINYRDTSRFQAWDYARLIESLLAFNETEEWNPKVPEIADKILLVGQTAEGLSDLGPTPYRGEEPLVTVQATGLSNILQNDFLKPVPMLPTLLIWLLLAWSTTWWLNRSPVSLAIFVPSIIILAYVASAFGLFQWNSVLLPLFLPAGGFFLLHSVTIADRLLAEAREKREIRNIFGAYAGQELVDSIIASGLRPQLGGERSDLTVFFSDIAGFSSFSEQLTPEELVNLMIRYMSEFTDVLMDNGGVLDKYIGDAIAAMFGVLAPFEDHAYRAVATTIHMQRKQQELTDSWREEGRWPEAVCSMRTRIGLNTGEAVIGNMGSRQRFNFTMTGDTVNLAARCESGAKTYGAFTMITESTMIAAKETRDDIVYRYLDKIVVMGRAQPVAVYEVIGFQENVPPNVSECLRIYRNGIDHYLKQEWDEARSYFARSAKVEPWQPDVHWGVKTNPSLVMLGRCDELEKNPPPKDWDGVYVMKGK